MKEPRHLAGFVTATVRKKLGSDARARTEHWPSEVAKIVKKAIPIDDLITADDSMDSLRVLRDAKNATHRKNDLSEERLVEVPDHRTRLAAVALELAYVQGRPIERQLNIAGEVNDLETMMERVRS